MSAPSQPHVVSLPPRAETLLAAELATFERELPRLLAEGEEGRWALVHGDTVASVWDTCPDAVQAGDERFGLVPFLVQQVVAEPIALRITRLFVPAKEVRLADLLHAAQSTTDFWDNPVDDEDWNDA